MENCHASGKLVGVWIDKDYAKEGEEFYQTLYKMGVDFFCSDYPDLVYSSIRNHYKLEHHDNNALKQTL